MNGSTTKAGPTRVWARFTGLLGRWWHVVLPPIGVVALLLTWDRKIGPVETALVAVLLIGAVLAAVHHAEVVAHRVGEPFGSLVLAVSVTVIEVGLILTLMLSSGSEPSSLARDTVFAAVMITLNGIVGISLLLGTVRHHLPRFNPEGTGAALAVVFPGVGDLDGHGGREVGLEVVEAGADRDLVGAGFEIEFGGHHPGPDRGPGLSVDVDRELDVGGVDAVGCGEHPGQRRAGDGQVGRRRQGRPGARRDRHRFGQGAVARFVGSDALDLDRVFGLGLQPVDGEVEGVGALHGLGSTAVDDHLEADHARHRCPPDEQLRGRGFDLDARHGKGRGQARFVVLPEEEARRHQHDEQQREQRQQHDHGSGEDRLLLEGDGPQVEERIVG